MTSIGAYEILEQVGAGAFGATFRARHRDGGEDVALKRLRLTGLAEWKPLERFEREAKVLRSLSHPNVVRFIEAFEHTADDGLSFYIVSEFVRGPTLAQKIADGGRWDEAAATELLTALLQTLAYLHGLSPRVVHRDIKPGNVVLADGVRPVLIDFGSVADVAPRTDGGLTIAGTAGYMAPEQAMGAVDPRADLYALGATIVHALTHVHPSELPRDGLSFDLSDRLGCSDRLRAILERLLEPDPSRRFQSAAQVLAALQSQDDEAPRKAGSKAALAPAPGALAKTDAAALVPATPRTLTPAAAKMLTVSRALRSRSPASLLMPWIGAIIAYMAMVVLVPSSFVPLVGVPMMMVALFGSMGVARASHRRLYREGTATTGTITAITSDQAGARVKFTYAVEGRTYEGLLATNDLLAIREADQGSPVHVFFDPRQPGRHLALLPRELPPASEEA